MDSVEHHDIVRAVARAQIEQEPIPFIIKMVTCLTIVLMVITIALEIQVQRRNETIIRVGDDARRAEIASREATEASKATSDLLTSVVNAQRANGVSQEATVAAITQISEINHKLDELLARQ